MSWSPGQRSYAINHWRRASRCHCGIFGTSKYTFAIIVWLHRILPLYVYNMLIMSKQKHFWRTKSQHIYSTDLLCLFLYPWICAILVCSLGSKKTSINKIAQGLGDAINRLMGSLSDCSRIRKDTLAAVLQLLLSGSRGIWLFKHPDLATSIPVEVCL